MESKTLTSSKDHRYYKTPNGGAMSCAIQHQRAYDPDDGQQAGLYGWCGYAENQSDYVLGPYASEAECFAAYKRKNPDHKPVKQVTLFRNQPPKFRVR